jgi:hypothetical protein
MGSSRAATKRAMLGGEGRGRWGPKTGRELSEGLFANWPMRHLFRAGGSSTYHTPPDTSSRGKK